MGSLETVENSFKRMVGYEACSAGELVVSFPGPYLEGLYESIARLSLKRLFSFHVRNPFQLTAERKRLLTKGVGFACCLFFAYLLGYSMVLDRKVEELEETYRAKKKAVAPIVRLEDRIKNRQKPYYELAQMIRSYPSKVSLLNILCEKIPENVVLLSLNVVERDVEIKGRAPRASEVLDILSSVQEIEGARFVSSVQKVGNSENLENFTIGFRLR
jgi:hypothetical protein